MATIPSAERLHKNRGHASDSHERSNRKIDLPRQDHHDHATASTPVTAVWRIRFEKFRGSRKTPSVTIVKMIQTPTRANTSP